MRYPLLVAIFAAIIITALAPLRAGTVTDALSAADLKTMCADTSGDSKSCSAYIAGFSKGFYYASVSTKAGFAPCLPRSLAVDQARLIVTQFMNAHTEMMQQGAPSVVASALIDAFPCSNVR